MAVAWATSVFCVKYEDKAKKISALLTARRLYKKQGDTKGDLRKIKTSARGSLVLLRKKSRAFAGL